MTTWVKARAWWSVATAAAVVWAAIPLLWLVSLSVKAPATISTDGGSFLPHSVTLDNYRGIFTSSLFTRAMLNSVTVAAISTLVAVVVGALAAYAVARLDFRGKSFLLAVALVVAVIPGISLISTLFVLERDSGIYNTWAGLVIPYVAFDLPIALYTLVAYFRSLPWELHDAAELDGASVWQSFRYVFAPLAAPGIATAAILVFIFCWNDFLFAVSLTADDSARTAPAAIAFFTGSTQFEEPIGSIAAAAVVITLPVLVFLLVFQRWVITGLTAGSVKA